MPASAPISVPPATDCRLYYSNALDVLAALLGRELAMPAPGASLLEPDVVLIPQYSMRRWLQQALAERFGICANLRFLAPGEFVELALDAALGIGDPAQRLAPETLRWRLLAALRDAQLTASPALAGIAGYLPSGDRHAEAPLLDWHLATDLAQTFERYQAWRRPMLLDWEAGREPRDWQAELWRIVGSGREHRARRVQRYLDRYGIQGGGPPPGLPRRLFVFACMDVSPDVLQVILSQARAGEQHVYLHSPCRQFWGDTGIGAFARAYSPADDARFTGRNPLLASCGLAGRDFIASLGSGEAVHGSFEARPFAEYRRDTLLGRLQSDVLDDLAPLQVDPERPSDATAAQWPRKHVDAGDASLQFHACHTPLREVQVLHDQLRALLDADASLQPRDIAVLAPDIEAYAPHIAAVFGGAERARFIPYGIAETGTLSAVPLAAALLRLCTLDRQPVTPADIRDLLGVPAVAARFGLQGDAVDAISHWLDQAGARWGLDAEDRARHGARPDPAYTLQFAIDRLLLGYAAGESQQIAGSAAWPGIEGRDSDVLDGLLRLLALLRDFTRELARPRTPQRWTASLDRLLVALVGEAPAGSDDRQALLELRRLLQQFGDSASLADFAQRIEPDILLQHLRQEIARPDLRAPLLSGGVAFGRMVPMRLIPFKVIALLGMDANAFPARDRRGAVDRIAAGLDSTRRRVGDPSHRDADRYLFLQLLTCAEQVFYLSWLGAEPRDGSAREPSVLVSELLDVAVAYHRSDNAATADRHRERLIVRHPLQPFSPAAYGAPLPGAQQEQAVVVEPRRFGFDSRWRAAARRDAQAASTSIPVFAPARPAARVAMQTLDIRDLYRFWRDPHADFVRETLGLQLPQDADPAPAHEPFGTPGGLAGYALRERVFAAMRTWRDHGGGENANTLHAHLVSEAMLLPGPAGEQQLRATLAGLRPYMALADAADLPPAQVLPVDLALQHWRLLGSVDGLHGNALLRWHLNGKPPHGAHWLRAWLDALAAAAVGSPAELLMLATDHDKQPPRMQRFAPPTPERARDGLQRLLNHMEHGRASPLVFLPQSAWCFHQCLAKAGREPDAAAIDKALDAARQRWHGESNYAEAGLATRIALRGREPVFQQDDPATREFMETATEVFSALRPQADGAP